MQIVTTLAQRTHENSMAGRASLPNPWDVSINQFYNQTCCPINSGVHPLSLSTVLRWKSSIFRPVLPVAALQKNCSKNTFPILYRRLIEGHGRITIISAENALYRSVNQLVNAGILERGLHRRERVLLPRYRSLLTGTVNFMDEVIQGKGIVAKPDKPKD